MIKKGFGFSLADVAHDKRDYTKDVNRAKKFVFTAILISFIVFVVIAALAINAVGLSTFFDYVTDLNLKYLILALGIMFFGYVIRYPKWHMYMEKLGAKINLKTDLMIYLSMYSMELTPGRWGRTVVSYTINRITKLKFGQIFPAVVADISTDFAGFSIVALGSAFLVNKFVPETVGLVILLFVPFFFLFKRKPFELLKNKLGNIKKLKTFFEVGDFYFESRKLLDKSVYLFSIIFTVPSVAMNGIALYVLMLGFGIHLTFAQLPIIMFIFSSSLLVGIVTGIPGGFGVTDAAMIEWLLLFFPGTIGFGFAAVITIVYRTISLWFVESFGAAALLHTLKY